MPREWAPSSTVLSSAAFPAISTPSAGVNETPPTAFSPRRSPCHSNAEGAFARYSLHEPRSTWRDASVCWPCPTNGPGSGPSRISKAKSFGLCLKPLTVAPARARRDYALLLTFLNTGARVQELLDVRPVDLQLVRPLQIRLCGKGRKERFCPIWPGTAAALRELVAEAGLIGSSTAGSSAIDVVSP